MNAVAAAAVIATIALLSALLSKYSSLATTPSVSLGISTKRLMVSSIIFVFIDHSLEIFKVVKVIVPVLKPVMSACVLATTLPLHLRVCVLREATDAVRIVRFVYVD